jgi:IS5 family transposase
VAFEYHDRTRVTKKLSYKITMAKGKGAKQKRKKCYRKLLKIAAEVLQMARSCSASLQTEELGFDEKSAALLIRKELDQYTALAEQCISQCERRVMIGESVPADQKVVSIFEPHTDIIRRGKTMSPTEFGHKVLVATGASGLVTQYKVCQGNPSDGEYVDELLAKHVEQFGCAPRAFAADRRFYSKANEELAAADPYNVERVSIPKPGHKNTQRSALEKEPWFKKLQRFRAGIEGGLSTLLRSFGLGRCLWRGWESFQSWVGLSVFAYNLRKIAALS